jgi:hypothetical protein
MFAHLSVPVELAIIGSIFLMSFVAMHWQELAWMVE